MNLLKNRKIAILITVIIVVLATLFGVSRSLNRLARNVEAMFYDGVYLEASGFVQPSISQHLDNLEQLVLDTSSVFAGHEGLSSEAEALMIARRSLVSAQTISDKHAAYQMILRAGTEFISKAETMELSERDRETFVSFQTTFRGATGAIQSSEYHVRVRGFMDEASIIARALRPFAFVTPPQPFDG